MLIEKVKRLKKAIERRIEKNSIRGVGNNYRWLLDNLVCESYTGQGDTRMNLMDRIISASRTKRRIMRTNSIGSTLYMVGAIEEDRYIDHHSGYDFVMGLLKRVQTPVIGGIITLERKERHIVQMGLITLVKPEIKVTTRRSRRGRLRVDVDPKKVRLDLERYGSAIKYYIYEGNTNRST